MKYTILTVALGVMIYSCAPYTEEGIDLPNPPSASFNWSFMPGDENTVIFESTSESGFLHFWDFGNGLTSNAKSDTIFYPQAGEFEVSYSVSNAGGMGTAEESIIIEQTVELPCEGTLELLTGCDNQKTWIFSQENAAIGVGPDPYDISWYASPESGLVPEQYDDSYQFTVDGEYIYD
ncbi:MAG: PKD domain-containing protein, partial [Flavobacteriales bacterium]|nr:PKD domain-containing protein [Flavobacteriales bacterium]